MTLDLDIELALIYARVSSVKQTKEGDGLGSQVTRCREYAHRKGYEVVQVFTDDVSGSLTRRRGMTAMLEFLDEAEHGPFVVLIDDGNRLARDVFAHRDIRMAIAMAGAFVETPNGRLRDDADSEFQEYIAALVAQHARKKNA